MGDFIVSDKPVLSTPTSPRLWRPDPTSRFEYDLKAFCPEAGTFKVELLCGDELRYLNAYVTKEYREQLGSRRVQLAKNRAEDHQIIARELAIIGEVGRITCGSFHLRASNIAMGSFHEITWAMAYLDDKELWVPSHPRPIKHGSSVLHEPMSGRNLWSVFCNDRTDGSPGPTPTKKENEMITGKHAVVSAHDSKTGEVIYLHDDVVLRKGYSQVNAVLANAFLSDALDGTNQLLIGKFAGGGVIKVYQRIESGGAYPDVKAMLATNKDEPERWDNVGVLPNGHPAAKRAFIMYSCDDNETTFPTQSKDTFNFHEADILDISTEGKRDDLRLHVANAQNDVTSIEAVWIP